MIEKTKKRLFHILFAAMVMGMLAGPIAGQPVTNDCQTVGTLCVG